MLSLILTLAMVPAAAPVAVAPAASQLSQVTTCQWPHKCADEIVAPVASVTTCVWPHVCAETPAAVLPALAQVTTCQWPHTCGKKS